MKGNKEGRKDGQNRRSDEKLICIDTGVGGSKVGREKGATDHLL